MNGIYFYFVNNLYFGKELIRHAQNRKNPLKRKVLFQISLRGLRRLIRDNNLREYSNVPFRVLQTIYNYTIHVFKYDANISGTIEKEKIVLLYTMYSV